NRLRDDRNRGQRLEYLRVGDRPPRPRPALGPQSLLHKLDLKQGHSLTPWVRGELEERFNYLCCETVEQFQSAPDLALTKERHLKARGRHIKDDRDRTVDPSTFVLGWDNREKRKHLSGIIETYSAQILRTQAKLDSLKAAIQTATARCGAIEQLVGVSSFADLDFLSEARKIESLQQERVALEEASDSIRVLRTKLSEINRVLEDRQKQRDDTITARATVHRDLEFAQGRCEDARRELKDMTAGGILERVRPVFAELEEMMTPPLSAADVVQREAGFRDARRAEVDRIRLELEPARNELGKLMNQYLRAFPSERNDREAAIEYLADFLRDYERIQQEDLPRHEKRFKERLNEKVTQEIGLLNAGFQTERAEIRKKIELLNGCLSQLEYRPGTHMRLEPRDVRDADILDFQTSLRECLSGAFEGTAAADEARYIRIAKLIEKLREDPRWRDRVTDVRRWFDFAAVETEIASGKERSYYEDSTGQSGGEKAKLAFTILVAAIAYQYDIDPAHRSSDRFHFVVVDEMFSKVDDQYSQYALELFRQFGLQLLIVAPLDAKARVTEPYVECYLHVVKDAKTNLSEIFTMTAREFEEAVVGTSLDTVPESRRK
ncbi:MAG TPA: SbcC/MukB-like Walker B domain-containing protein, partial [Terriglobales bacterium]|nr:SbcC/MukB-like Walker B domain-containing protein [Terriglobales bacterium]